ncbi:MAG TPA: FlgD immunoglobulin-like domain containing protein, partial [Candidatus Eisenbacteria bacterium]|nr:FlgD immunoglobulin-like domain containing protein [Candidatus Eisenbacteria bacterium]
EDWTGITQAISGGVVDSTVARYMKIWINDFTYLHDSTTAILRIDLGRVSEDAFWSRTAPPNGHLDTEDKNFDGKLGLGDPLGFDFEDTGLDGIVSALEPGYDPATNPDPNADDYVYDSETSPDDYSTIDNFEKNGLGSPLARPETEDLDRDTILDTENAYFEATIDLSDTAYVAIDVPRDYAGHPNVEPGNGWRLFRIPLSAEAFRAVGPASWESVRHLRLWIGDMSREIMLQIGGIQIDGFTSPPAVDRVALYQNRPNPFNPNTTIPYELEKSGEVRMAVYDVQGRLIRELVDAVMTEGPHWATWDGVDRNGRAAASGVYLYQISADGKQEARRMVLMR